MLKARGLLPKFDSHIDAYCLIEDEALRDASLDLVQHLRDQGFAVEYSLTPAKSDKQFKRAMELGALLTLQAGARRRTGAWRSKSRTWQRARKKPWTAAA